MSKNVKGIIVVAILLIGGYAVYRNVFVSLDAKIDFLIKNNYSQGSPAALKALQPEFIAAWYKSAKIESSTFLFNNKSYKTSGGVAV